MITTLKTYKNSSNKPIEIDTTNKDNVAWAETWGNLFFFNVQGTLLSSRMMSGPLNDNDKKAILDILVSLFINLKLCDISKNSTHISKGLITFLCKNQNKFGLNQLEMEAISKDNIAGINEMLEIFNNHPSVRTFKELKISKFIDTKLDLSKLKDLEKLEIENIHKGAEIIVSGLKLRTLICGPSNFNYQIIKNLWSGIEPLQLKILAFEPMNGQFDLQAFKNLEYLILGRMQNGAKVLVSDNLTSLKILEVSTSVKGSEIMISNEVLIDIAKKTNIITFRYIQPIECNEIDLSFLRVFTKLEKLVIDMPKFQVDLLNLKNSTCLISLELYGNIQGIIDLKSIKQLAYFTFNQRGKEQNYKIEGIENLKKLEAYDIQKIGYRNDTLSSSVGITNNDADISKKAWGNVSFLNDKGILSSMEIAGAFMKNEMLDIFKGFQWIKLDLMNISENMTHIKVLLTFLCSNPEKFGLKELKIKDEIRSCNVNQINELLAIFINNPQANKLEKFIVIDLSIELNLSAFKNLKQLIVEGFRKQAKIIAPGLKLESLICGRSNGNNEIINNLLSNIDPTQLKTLEFEPWNGKFDLSAFKNLEYLNLGMALDDAKILVSNELKSLRTLEVGTRVKRPDIKIPKEILRDIAEKTNITTLKYTLKTTSCHEIDLSFLPFFTKLEKLVIDIPEFKMDLSVLKNFTSLKSLELHGIINGPVDLEYAKNLENFVFSSNYHYLKHKI